MVKWKFFEKYNIKRIVIILSVVLMATLAVFFMVMGENVAKLEAELSQASGERIKVLAEEIAVAEMYKENTLIFLSVFASAFISAVFIERNNANKIVEDVFVNDVFTSDRFWNMLTEEEREQALVKLDGLSHFGGNIVKGEMYNTVKKKINAFDGNKSDFYYEDYYLDIKCRVTPRFIEKKVVKRTKIKTFDNDKTVSDFVLLAISTPEQNEYVPAEITGLKINGEPIDKKDITPHRRRHDTRNLAGKRGYTYYSSFTYNQPIIISSETAQTIEIEYITRCPVNDLAYSLRMPCACKNFQVNFAVRTKEYVLNPTAFGFIDDAHDTPNHEDDRSSVTFRFNDWIFPQDGICVYLEKKVAD